jgi:hypothetical protein
MKTHVYEYWRQRLMEGQIFAQPSCRKEGRDFRITRGGTPSWPERVAKEALYLDFCEWVRTQSEHWEINMAEFFRLMEPMLFIFGKRYHTARHLINSPLWTGDRSMQGRAPRAFVKLLPLGVMRAQHAIVVKAGTTSERDGWRKMIEDCRKNVGVSTPVDVAAWPQG